MGRKAVLHADCCGQAGRCCASCGGLKSLAGGNIREYVEVCEQARHDAYGDMLEHARKLGADAIIGMRYDATEFSQGATEVLAYGTAVTLVRDKS